jgi:hypothetical protein
VDANTDLGTEEHTVSALQSWDAHRFCNRPLPRTPRREDEVIVRMDVNSRLKGVDVKQNLEKLISAHQILSYPSRYQSFNRAYEGALQSLSSSALVREL